MHLVFQQETGLMLNFTNINMRAISSLQERGASRLKAAQGSRVHHFICDQVPQTKTTSRLGGLGSQCASSNFLVNTAQGFLELLETSTIAVISQHIQIKACC